MTSTWIYILLSCGGIIFIAFVAKRAGWFELINGTNKLLREQNTVLRDANLLLKQQLKDQEKHHEAEKAEWEDKYHENKELIAKLEGRLDQTINIPLVEIDKSLHELAKANMLNAETSQKVLDVLVKSAEIVAKEKLDIDKCQNG
jgi:hypothetical protein